MRNGLMLVGALVIMFALSWRLTMVTFMIVPVVAFATRLYGLNYDVRFDHFRVASYSTELGQLLLYNE